MVVVVGFEVSLGNLQVPAIISLTGFCPAEPTTTTTTTAAARRSGACPEVSRVRRRLSSESADGTEGCRER